MADNILENNKEKTSVIEKEEKEQKKTSAPNADRRRKTSLKRKKRRRQRYNYGFIAMIIIPIVLLILIIFGIRGCGMNLKNPKKTAENYITNAVKGDANKVKRCYGITGEASEDVQTEISTIIKFYEAHGAKSIKIKSCDTLFDEEEYSYVEVVYNLVLEDEKEYPCIKTFMMRKESGKYYVLSAVEITSELSEKAVEAYNKFMTTDIYKTYTKDYNTFMKQNPGYEERIAGKIN